MAYTVSKQYALASAEGDARRTTGKMIVLHSTANLNAPAANNAAFEKRTWNSNSAYVHYIVGDGIVYEVGTPGYRAWGAGQTANALAPVQVEMEESSDVAKQKRIYATYIALVRDMASKYGVPLTLDAAGNTGIKTHDWCSKTYHETDHTDPWAALARIGVDRAQLASDLAHGAGAVTATKPAATTASKPAAAKPAAAPKTYKDGQYTITAENGTFYPDRTLSVWYYPGVQPTGAKYHAGESVQYYGYVRNGAYLYVAYHATDGYTHYVACRDYTNGNEALGSFK